MPSDDIVITDAIHVLLRRVEAIEEREANYIQVKDQDEYTGKRSG